MASSDYKYCPRCATPVTLEDRYGAVRAVCPNCRWIHFFDPKVAAAVLVEHEGRVLLVRASVLRAGGKDRVVWLRRMTKP